MLHLFLNPTMVHTKHQNVTSHSIQLRIKQRIAEPESWLFHHLWLPYIIMIFCNFLKCTVHCAVHYRELILAMHLTSIIEPFKTSRICQQNHSCAVKDKISQIGRIENPKDLAKRVWKSNKCLFFMWSRVRISSRPNILNSRGPLEGLSGL